MRVQGYIADARDHARLASRRVVRCINHVADKPTRRALEQAFRRLADAEVELVAALENAKEAKLP